ncbi:MAG: hypothetical protein LBV44_09645 [Methylobacillus sp.]|jgi:hypothetical protein|nr:hypothetical protein [Methylobacillus sp.]
MMKISGTLFKTLLILALTIPFAHAADDTWLKDKNGCAVFNPDPQPSESIVWSGKCKDGYAEGAGTLTWTVGGELDSTSTGTWKRGKMVGKGSIVYGNGERYDGGFLNDYWHGTGIYTMPDGRRYEGNFVEGDPKGDGIITDSNGKKHPGSLDEFFDQ